MVDLYKKNQFLVAIEDLENTAETLVAADAILALDSTAKPNKAMIDRDTVRTTLSMEKQVVGRKSTSYTFGLDMVGGGSAVFATAPPWGKVLRACSFLETVDGVEYVNTSAGGVTGEIQAGVTLTGASSGATGQVLFTYPVGGGATKIFLRGTTGTYSTTENLQVSGVTKAVSAGASPEGTDGHLYTPASIVSSKVNYSGAAGSPQVGETFIGGTSFSAGVYVSSNGTSAIFEPIVGVPFLVTATEVLTGQTSGATFTVSNPTAQTQWHSPSLTIAHKHQTRQLNATGCRGNVVFNFKTGEPARMDFSFQGSPNNDGWSTLETGITYPSTPRQRFAGGAMLTAGTYRFPVGQVTIDMGNTVTMRQDPNATSGDRGAIVTARSPTMTHDPDHVSPQVWDWIARWEAETSYATLLSLGTTPGNRVAVYAPAAQVTDFSNQDRDGLQAAGLTSMLNRSAVDGDDELYIYVA